jgi:transcriptional regulator with XRE-family HTH domain/tetratricopeptide (TPR) repeat protein
MESDGGQLFGVLLRDHRLAAALTQEALAERAGLSVTAVSALERGRRRAPRLSTVRDLAGALGLDESDRRSLALAASVESARPGGTKEAPTPPAPDLARRRALEPSSPSTSVSVPLPEIVGLRRRRTLVGRAAELSRLTGAFASRDRFVLLAGEPGSGKTRLAEETARQVHSAGGMVAWGRCTEEQLGAFEPFVEVLRFLSGALDDERLSLGLAGRGELRRLVPEIAARGGALRPVVQADAGTEQRFLFEAVTGLLRACGPLLVVLEDLHWSDPDSLALLDYLVADPALGDVVVLGTARPDDLSAQQAGRLAALGRHAVTLRVEVGGLEPDDLALLMGEVLGGTVPPELLAVVAQSTEGNAFFAEELTAHLVDTGTVTVGNPPKVVGDLGRAGVPVRVREMLVQRQATLSAATTALLRAGAVVGREFELALVGQVGELAGETLLEATDDAILSGLVVERPNGRLCFTHSLVQQTVNDELSALRRSALHRRAAQVLEVTQGRDPGWTAEIARHWLAVALTDDTALANAATWAVRAGDAALAAAASDEAIARYEQATTLWAAATVGHVDALVRLGSALRHVGRTEEADERFREALRLADVIGHTALRAQAAIGLGETLLFGAVDHERVGALEAALSGLGAADNAQRFTLLASLAAQLTFATTPAALARRDEVVRLMVAINEEVDDPDLLLGLGRGWMFVTVLPSDVLEGVAARLVEVATDRSDLAVLNHAWFATAWAAMERGDPAGLARGASQFSVSSEQLREPLRQHMAAVVQGGIALMRGDYTAAASISEQALAFGTDANSPNASALYFAQASMRMFDAGPLDEAWAFMQSLAEQFDAVPTFRVGFTLCAALAGDLEQATLALDRFVADGLDRLARNVEWPAIMAMLAHTCCVLGATDQARLVEPVLSSATAPVVRVGPMAGWWGPVDHHLGGLSRVLGRPDEAVARLERALAIDVRMKARPFEARTRLELALALRRRGTPGDRRRADDLESAARTTAVEVGAHALATPYDSAG